MSAAILYNKDDFKFAEEQAKKVSDKCILFLQPEWSRREKVMPLLVNFVLQNPKWKVSLQTHKYLNIPKGYIKYFFLIFLNFSSSTRQLSLISISLSLEISCSFKFLFPAMRLNPFKKKASRSGKFL